jgi:hypothetical protein
MCTMPDRTDLADGLSPASIRNACADIGMSDVSTRILVDAASAIAGSARLRDVAIRCARLVFDSGLPAKEAVAAWPVAADRNGLPPFFDPTVLLAGYRRLSADHRRRGIPPAVTRGTLRDLDLWMEHHRAATGAWVPRETGWIARHFTSRLFQLGRLQFEPHPFTLPFAVFSSRRGTSLAVLAEGGREFREDGQFADADGDSAAAPRTRGTWTSRFVDTGNGWHGSAVDAAGRMRLPPVVLDRNDWHLAAQRGDPALAVHIPAAGRFNGPMTRDACADSFRCAIPFFAKFLPGFRPLLFTCESWMLDPQLAQFLPPESRIVSFQQFFQLLPVPGADGRQAFERVFGGPVDDWSKVPRDTALRRMMAEQAAVGISWRIGAGVMLPEGRTGR